MNARLSRLISAAIVMLAIVLILSGCVSTTTDRARDAKEADKATISGYGDIRTYLDVRLDEVQRNNTGWAPRDDGNGLDVLMISGGGSAGAFTVGILSAWSKAGTRPHFDAVTGVSTGALIAPFAFLGSEYDDTLRYLYTSGVANGLVEPNGVEGLFGSSLLRGGPLRTMVERYITPTILARIAAEHRKGRRLLVLTTNLDTQRAVIWNMGAIAASGRPGALKLFQDVIIASASIPGLYPAVMIDAESGGHRFHELHSDGGSASQILMMPQAVLANGDHMPKRRHNRGKVNFYVIVNNALMPEFGTTPNRTFSVLFRAYSIFVKSQTQSALTALYNFSKLTGAGYHLATIDVQVPYSALDPFNANYMRAVYNLGYAEFSTGTLWKSSPIFR